MMWAGFYERGMSREDFSVAGRQSLSSTASPTSPAGLTRPQPPRQQLPVPGLQRLDREAVSAAPLKTYFSVRLWLTVKPRVAGDLCLRRSPAPTRWWSALDLVTTANPQYDQNWRLLRNCSDVTTT